MSLSTNYTQVKKTTVESQKPLFSQQSVFMRRHIKPILQVIVFATIMLVAFFVRYGSGKHNKMYRKFLFRSDHTTKVQSNDEDICTHTRLKC